MRSALYHRRRRGLSGLGAPILPDQFTTAAGVPESFSPGTPDATIVAILQSQGQALPPSLVAAMAAQQTVTQATTVPSTTTSPTPVVAPDPSSSPANPAPGAVTPSGAPISTQTGAAVTLLTTINVAPGVWQCVMSDGSSHYCDSAARPISYTPPAAQPATTPAAGSQPTSTVQPTPGAPPVTVVAVTPAGGQISTTNAAPAATPAAGQSSFVESALAWLEGSMIGGIANWLLLGGAALLFLSDSGSTSRKR
jgi:hypothetical protein